MGEIGFKIFAAYCAMAFIKFMLASTTLPVAIMAMSRMVTRRRGQIAWGYALLVSLLTIAVSFFCWIPTLRREGFRFFSVYRDVDVMRAVVRGHRDALH